MGYHWYDDLEPCENCSECVCDWLAGRTKHKRDCVLHYHDYDHDYDSQCDRP
jgi:hypothetical protein